MTKHYDPAAVAALTTLLDRIDEMPNPHSDPMRHYYNQMQVWKDEAREVIAALKPTEPAPAPCSVDGCNEPHEPMCRKHARIFAGVVAGDRDAVREAVYAPASAGLLAAAEHIVRIIDNGPKDSWVALHGLAVDRLRDAIAAEKARGPDDTLRKALMELREKNQRLPFDAVDDELGRIIAMLDNRDATIADLRERLAKAQCDYAAVAQAIGVAYEAEGHDVVGGPVDEVVEQAGKNREQALLADEWEAKAVAEEERAEKAEANSGAAVLRRLRADLTGLHDWVSDKGQKWGLARAIQHADSLLAEIEQPAADKPEPCSHCDTTIVRGGCGVCGEPADKPDPKEREGDDVLRRCAKMIEDVYGEEDGSSDALCDHFALAELCRRALGGGA